MANGVELARQCGDYYLWLEEEWNKAKTRGLGHRLDILFENQIEIMKLLEFMYDEPLKDIYKAVLQKNES